MIFAFAVSAMLFNAALQWEARSDSVRQAAFLAERKLGEIRAWSEEYHATHPFDDGWSPPITGIQSGFVGSSGFEIEVMADQPTYGRSPTSGLTPPAGMYSPTSHYYLLSGEPNKQRNTEYSTYPYTRDLSSSYRRVQVIVRYGTNNSREFRAVTLVGDPLTKPSNLQITITPTSGGGGVSPGNPLEYEVRVNVNGHVVRDVVCLWGVIPTSTGTVQLTPLDPNGRTVRVTRPSFGNPGTTRLSARIRYRGREYLETSGPISVL